MPADNPKIPHREQVIEQCQKAGKLNDSFAWDDHIWIKFGQHITQAEADIQKYVRHHVDPNIVYIPEVFAVYEAYNKKYEAKMTYLVMERVKGKHFMTHLKQHPTHIEQLVDATAKAIEHIWNVPPPQDAKPGPFHGAEPMGGFFGPMGAGRIFDNLQELEEWINKTLERLDPRHNSRISLQGEHMHICHCDFNPSNVFISDQAGGPITIIDWGAAGVYPKCFDQIGLRVQCRSPDAKFARELYKHLYGPPSERSERILALERVAGY